MQRYCHTLKGRLVTNTPITDRLVNIYESGMPIPDNLAVSAAETLAQLILTVNVPIDDHGKLARTVSTYYVKIFVELGLHRGLKGTGDHTHL